MVRSQCSQGVLTSSKSVVNDENDKESSRDNIS